MKLQYHWTKRAWAVVLLLCALLLVPLSSALADATAQSLPFSQNWSNTGLITASDDWSGVPGIEGYRGDGLTAATGVDPQTVLAADDPGVIDVNPDRSDPDTYTTGGVTEFDGITDPVVALNGSGTADAPYLRITIDTTGLSHIRVSYNLRDLDGSTDNSQQQVALQYRVGTSGDFTNVPAGYVADATTGPSEATLVTPVDVELPSDASNQAVVQIRIMTTNAVGNDEWVGVDDIYIYADPTAVTLASFSSASDSRALAGVFLALGLAVALPVGAFLIRRRT